jgi:hypothetical protein
MKKTQGSGITRMSFRNTAKRKGKKKLERGLPDVVF